MARKNKTRKPEKEPRTIVLNPQTISEDEADYLFYLKHRHEKKHSLDKVMRDAGFKVERRVS